MTKIIPQNPNVSLNGKVLVANQSLDGTYFEKTVIYICSHDDEGAVGVIINKVEKTYTQHDLRKNFSNLSNFVDSDSTIPAHFGGPIDDEKHYILFDDQSVLKGNETLSLFDNADLFLKDHFNHLNHSDFLLLKGCCSWGPQQIEEEIRENSWLITTIDNKDIFNTKSKKSLWNRLIKKLGITDFNNLVNYSGNA